MFRQFGEAKTSKRIFPIGSWTSVDEEAWCFIFGKTSSVVIEIIYARCELLGSGPPGGVRSGKIILKGLLEPLKSLSAK